MAKPMLVCAGVDDNVHDYQPLWPTTARSSTPYRRGTIAATRARNAVLVQVEPRPLERGPSAGTLDRLAETEVEMDETDRSPQ